MSNEAF